VSTATRNRPSRKAPARGSARNSARKRRSPAAAPFVGIGRALAAIWRALAALIGGTARAAGRNAATARDLPPEHRRDGVALGVLAFGLISATGIWFSAAGPVGKAMDTAARAVVGNGALLVPLVLFLAGGHMLRQAPEPTGRGRVLVGALATTVSVLGLLDVWANSPTSGSGRAHAGGIVGSGIGKPLSAGLSAVLAVPVLALIGVFGILVVTATPLSVLVGYLRSLLGFGSAIEEDDEDEEAEEDDLDEVAPAPRQRRRRLRLDADPEAATSEIPEPELEPEADGPPGADGPPRFFARRSRRISIRIGRTEIRTMIATTGRM